MYIYIHIYIYIYTSPKSICIQAKSFSPMKSVLTDLIFSATCPESVLTEFLGKYSTTEFSSSVLAVFVSTFTIPNDDEIYICIYAYLYVYI
jgi:hypothetical protein